MRAGALLGGLLLAALTAAQKPRHGRPPRWHSESFAASTAPCAEARSWVATDQAAGFAISAAAPVILVHYHYFEDEETPAWQVINKRTNLLFFLRFAARDAPRSVKVVLTVGGTGLPTADAFFQSVGYPQDLHEQWGRDLLPPDVVLRAAATATADLCPRAAVLREFVLGVSTRPDYVLFLNDGVRGPFEPALGTVARRGRDAAAAKLGLPTWAARFVSALRASPEARVIGAVGSCEFDVHVQSWAMMIDARLAAKFAANYAATCEMDKKNAIYYGEIGACVMTLRANHTILSIWPKLELAGALRACVHHAPAAVPKTRAQLWQCFNMFSGAPGEGRVPPELDDVVFTKFGGSVWVKLPQSYKDLVVEYTGRALLGNSSASLGGHSPRLAEYALTRPPPPPPPPRVRKPAVKKKPRKAKPRRPRDPKHG
ncbi:hypothetical protein M885DRAFT_506999 [Pelagophyceae sp. CCMP2097]|nr:hypothetical protein M885DRAFT_506999 [Pelagophyceae sp. CCMP2097]